MVLWAATWMVSGDIQAGQARQASRSFLILSFVCVNSWSLEKLDKNLMHCV